MAIEGDPPTEWGGDGVGLLGLEDAVGALTALGYPARDARRAVEAVRQESPEVPLDESIRRALHRLSRREA